MKRITLPILFLVALALLVAVNAPSANAQTTGALWFATFWNNPNQSGDPAATMSEGLIDHDWGTSAPRAGIDPETWSARWTSYGVFEPGTYRFTVTSDDGTRVFLGTKHILVDWAARPVKTNTVMVSLTGGTYPVAVDYFDDVGAAELHVSWERISGPVANAADVTVVSSSTGTATPPVVATGTFRGEYFNNSTLTGSPVLTRDDAAINFNWGTGSPSATIVVADNFSVRWTGTLNLIPGRYRFAVTSDDGARLWLNNTLLVDRWADQQATTAYAEIDWPGGNLPVQMTYFDHGGLAIASLTWTRIGAAPNTGGQAVATVRVSGLNVRTGPAVGFQLITTIPFGTAVTLLGRNADATWAFVLLPDGRQGWVSAIYLTTPIPITDLPLM